ncbi:hypothetical protein mRhiFer1_009239 [Rhinolophus ferrumequinum]|uniref:Uncharacterized protein n=1 Tax=Rhinolophus ferrumequinum TaxID=59479 RepID=A0A7J7S804_RHIFE|nr:hypothetical protein mRhiFer1_009239 [Rhinolophus ferrumequinum]
MSSITSVPHPEVVLLLQNWKKKPADSTFSRLYCLENAALICPTDTYTQFHPSIYLVLVLPEDTTSYQIEQASSLDIKGNPIIPVFILQCLLRGLSDLPSMFTGSSRLNPVVTFYLQFPECISSLFVVSKQGRNVISSLP